MKGFRKSTRIAYWVLRALAISSALLLFSITGIVALQSASHATGTVMTVSSTTAGVTSSPADSSATPTPTPTATSTTVPIPTATPQPTAIPTPTPTPTPKPTQPPVPTAIPTVNNGVPIVTPTATSAAIGPAAPLPTPTLKGTPKVTPSPTPSGSPTPTSTSTQVPVLSHGNTSGSSTTQQNSDGGMMATIKPLIGPIAGVSTTILLGSVGLLALLFWRKRTAAQGAAPSFAQAHGVWGGAQATGSAQPAELTPAQNKTMPPFAMQSIVQYSPLLGAPDTSQLDAPVLPPASDFRPLTIDYPQIMEIHTDKTPVPVTPAALQSLLPTKSAELQPQLASTQFSPPSASIEASSTPASIQTLFPPTQQNVPVAYQFPQYDSLLENLMRQAQMGIFALPGKEA